MRKFELKKLVRDNILAEMESADQRVAYKKLGDAEYVKALAAKLVEEAREFKLGDPAEALKELSDLLEVVETLAQQLGADFNQLRTVQKERRFKRGGFANRTFIETVTVAGDDPWAEYYAKGPDRFKEITE